MMRMMNNKANVKIFSIVIATVFIIGIGALAYTQMATPSGNGGASTIGVIDTSRMMSQDNPLFVSAAQEFMSYQSQLQQETQAKIDAAQDDATKQKIVEEMRQNLAKKDQEIAKSIQDKAMEAAKAVGDGKGLRLPRNSTCSYPKRLLPFHPTLPCGKQRFYYIHTNRMWR